MIPVEAITLVKLPFALLTLEPTGEWVFAFGLNVTSKEAAIAFGPAALILEVGTDA